jgi:hypothetical protein
LHARRIENEHGFVARRRLDDHIAAVAQIICDLAPDHDVGLEDEHDRRLATGIAFRETEGSYDFGFHHAPRRQYIVNLDAAVELETGDGTKRVIGPGEILLAEDLTGRGHISRAVDGRPRRSLVVTID